MPTTSPLIFSQNNPSQNMDPEIAGLPIVRGRASPSPEAAPPYRLQRIAIAGHARTFVERAGRYHVQPLSHAKIEIFERRTAHRCYPAQPDGRWTPGLYLDPDAVYTLGVCQTLSDEAGRFTCIFNWWPEHGLDKGAPLTARPSIVVKLTQTIGGVAKALYMDPYRRNRWYGRHAHVDLWRHTEHIPCDPYRPGRADATAQAPKLDAPRHPWW